MGTNEWFDLYQSHQEEMQCNDGDLQPCVVIETQREVLLRRVSASLLDVILSRMGRIASLDIWSVNSQRSLLESYFVTLLQEIGIQCTVHLNTSRSPLLFPHVPLEQYDKFDEFATHFFDSMLRAPHGNVLLLVHDDGNYFTDSVENEHKLQIYSKRFLGIKIHIPSEFQHTQLVTLVPTTAEFETLFQRFQLVVYPEEADQF